MQILWYVAIGLIVGVLGRLVVPRVTPMDVLRGALLGVVGGLLGGLLGGLIATEVGLGDAVALIISVAVAALLVFLVSARAAPAPDRAHRRSSRSARG